MMDNSQLDLFSLPTYQDELFGAQYHTERPFTPLADGPIDFIMKDKKDYYDLKDTTLSLSVKVVNADGTNIKVENGKDDVAIINNVMHSIFSDVSITLNSKRIEGGDENYGYKSYLSTVFRFSENTQKNQLFAIGFVRDDYSKMDAATNAAFVTRKGWTANGAIKSFYGKLNCAFFRQRRALIPGVDMHIKFERAKDAFALFSTAAGLKPKIVITEMALHFKILKPNPSIVQKHMLALSRNIPVVYPLQRVELDIIPMKEKSLGEIKENLFYGRVPKYLILLMTSTNAYYGDYTKNPYNFKPYNLKYLKLTRDGEEIPFEEFEPDFKTGNCLREYMSLYESNNLLGTDTTLPISIDEFQNGYTNFQFNLSDNGKGTNANPDQRANLKLSVKFADALAEAITVIAYGIFDSIVQVYGDDRVLVDGV